MIQHFFNKSLRPLMLMAVSCLCAGLLGCDGGGSGNDDNINTEGISGEARLEVNVVNAVTNVYFDEKLIGTVGPGETRRFNVPTGTHQLKFENVEVETPIAGVEDVVFEKGQTATFFIKWSDTGSFVSRSPFPQLN